MIKNHPDVTNNVIIHQEDDKESKMADSKADVPRCPGDQIANKKDTASNKINIGQYDGKYSSHINTHTHSRYTNEAKDRVQRDITQDDLDHLNY